MRRRLPSAFVVELAREVIARGGVLCFVARGHSMRPALDDGVRVVIAARRADLGAVVLALTAQGPRLHRVLARRMARGAMQLLLRGDAQRGPGEWVDTAQVVGSVVAARNPRARVLRLLRGAARVLRLAA